MLFARDAGAVKKDLTELAAAAVEAMLATAEGDGTSVRAVEQLAWKFAVQFGAELMRVGAAELCAQATAADLEERGLGSQDVSLRMDGDYWCKLNTTFGPVAFPWFAYRDRSVSVGASSTSRSTTSTL